jgi:hypothetical protein
VPLIGGVLWWGIPERGGYLLGPAFLLACLLALAGSRATRLGAAGMATAAILVQAALAWPFVHGFDLEGSALDDRVARIRSVLGESGHVLSCNDNAPTVQLWLPGVQETALLSGLANDLPLAVLQDGLRPIVQRLVRQGRLVVDVSYRLRTDMIDRVREATAAFEQMLRAEYRVTESPDPVWPLLLVEPR